MAASIATSVHTPVDFPMTLLSQLQVRLRISPFVTAPGRAGCVVALFALGWLWVQPMWAQGVATAEEGESQKPAPVAETGTADDYESQRRRIAAGDAAADFTALRTGFTRTRHYVENMNRAVMLNQAMFNAMDRDAFERCSELASEALMHDYTNLQSHYGAMVCHFQLGNDGRGQHHQWVMQGLLNSLRASGVGTDPNRPYRPINADEVDGFLRLMGYEVRNRVATVKDGRPLDVITVYDAHQEESQQLFFDASPYREDS